jgi:predicted RNA-binding Zn-ribbon protein involved in translation (DUF1610 family)
MGIVQKRSPFSAPTSRDFTTTWKSTVGSQFMCPNCGNHEKDCASFDAETMTFKCRECGIKWTQKKGTFEYVSSNEPLKDEIDEKKKKRHWFF